ncbi:MAG: TetR/AcrR family transcriptional regulator [Pseudomonadota bacterium]
MAKRPARRQNDTQVTRDAIAEAAERLIVQGGVHALNISKIARELGMSHGNVYRHFSSKDELAAEIAMRWMGETRDACQSAVDIDAPAAERLRALVMTIRKQILSRANNPDAFAIYRFVLEHRPAEALAHHQHRRNLIVRILEDANFSTDQSLAAEAERFLDALRFFIDPFAMVAYRNVDMTARIEQVVDLLAGYIQSRT